MTQASAPPGVPAKSQISWGGLAPGRLGREDARNFGGGTLTLLDVIAGGAKDGALEVVAHESAAGLEKLIEKLEQPSLGDLRFAPFGLDALADVVVEKLDGLARGSFDARRVFLTKL